MEAQIIIITSKCNQKYKPQRKFRLKLGSKRNDLFNIVAKLTKINHQLVLTFHNSTAVMTL